MAKKPKSKISDQWQPDALCITWAVEKYRWSQQRIFDEGIRFRNWHLDNDVGRADFYHAWQNWCAKTNGQQQNWRQFAPETGTRAPFVSEPDTSPPTPEERARVAAMAQEFREAAKAMTLSPRYVRERPRLGHEDRVAADLLRRKIMREQAQ